MDDTTEDPYNAPSYSISEVAHLVKINKARARRWINGYNYRSINGELRSSPPLVNSEIDASFFELMELKYASMFILNYGFNLQKVRLAFNEAREITGLEHPFANKIVYVCGSDIYLKMESALSSKEYPELRSLLQKGQQGANPIITSVGEQIIFDNNGYVEKWYPAGIKNRVVVDPKKRGGRPVIEGTRLTTKDILSSYQSAESSISKVASDFKISETLVLAAIEFELRPVAA